jgi:GxxExxY protein
LGQLKHADLTERIIGVFYDVYNELGFGFLESVYEASMVLALEQSGLKVARHPVPVWFRGQQVGTFFANLMVNDRVLVKLKTARTLETAHEAQLLQYLRATEIEVGLLLNFGPQARFRRLLFENERKKIRENPCESVAEVLLK